MCLARGNANTFGLYTAAAVLVPSIVPYTLVFIGPVNEKLIAKADSTVESTAGEAIGEDTNALLDKWALLNSVRVILSGTADVLVAWASIGPFETAVVESVSLASGANRLG